MFSVAPAGKDAYAVGSTLSVLSVLSAIPVVSPDEVSPVIVKVAPASTSVAPDSRSTVKIAPVSSAAPVIAPDTSGTSLTAVMLRDAEVDTDVVPSVTS